MFSFVYYSLNADLNGVIGVTLVEEDFIHGSALVAESVTANKIRVDDLVAFGANIAGFSINNNVVKNIYYVVTYDSTTNEYVTTSQVIDPVDGTLVESVYTTDGRQVYTLQDGSFYCIAEVKLGKIYSGVKDDPRNDTAGIYLDRDGQISFGDGRNFIRFCKVLDENNIEVVDDQGNPIYKLEISADSIVFGDDSSELNAMKALTEHVKIGRWTDPETGDVNPSVELSEGDSDFKQVITNKASRIIDGENIVTEMDVEGVETRNVTINNELRQGKWAWVQHGSGNLGVIWKEVSS